MRNCLLIAATLTLLTTVRAQTPVVIDHHFSNTDAQSLIGLPMGSHKTTVDKKGNLKWSQWSLKRRELDSPIGFSAQMDGGLTITASLNTNSTPQAFNVEGQHLYRNRYPFVVTNLSASNVTLEELALAADPDNIPSALPNAHSGTHALDLIRLTFTNNTATSQIIELRLSGRERNLPGHVTRSALITHGGEDVALLTAGDGATISAKDNGLTLSAQLTLVPHSHHVAWLRLPYEYPAAKNMQLTPLSNDHLLEKAIAQWNGLWARGTRIEVPQQDLDDFYQASIAYLLMLTEYDNHGDLWVLDGPDVYRQYWGRGEYFQARAMEVAGYLAPARESVVHALHIQNDDGEWDGPPASGWPAWDNSGGNVASVWEYFQYTRDKQFLAAAYPFMLNASRWIRDHREESKLEDDDTVPQGARPIRRMISSKCRTEPQPKLKPGEHTYWYGLLPWSYGDSGLPEGHSFSHNFLADYAVKVTAEAAHTLNHPTDEQWLNQEYADFTSAIRTSVDRAVTLEKISPPYLPAMPTYPEGAYSQTFLAIFPTALYKPTDPLVEGLLARMEHEEKQGVPTNVAWAGAAGVWPGEAMNMAETYLLRDDAEHTASMLLAAANHSYTTDTFKEEILVDITQPRACDTPHSKRANGEGTGDQPEAWGSANYVDLFRDMLVQERDDAVHLLSGIPHNWIKPGQHITVDQAPLNTGARLSYTFSYIDKNHLKLHLAITQPTRFVLHLPLNPEEIDEVRVNNAPGWIASTVPFTATTSADIEVRFKHRYMIH
ncbi:MAG: hypothetical protein V4555_08690 [Acidobacteriota bacterium]